MTPADREEAAARHIALILGNPQNCNCARCMADYCIEIDFLTALTNPANAGDGSDMNVEQWGGLFRTDKE